MATRKTKSKPQGYIETRPGVRGGAPVITGTGIKVLDALEQFREIASDLGNGTIP